MYHFFFLEIEVCPENLIALDCEMVGIGKSKSNALARCSVVDYYGNVLYDQYIKPSKSITDYRTKWSGILPRHMTHAIPFKVARKQILSVIKENIIIGHSLHFDFKILKISRRKHQIRDTSHSLMLRNIAGFPLNQTASLKRLSSAILGRQIQVDTHCSVEDSVAAMDLYRTIEQDWEKNFQCKKEAKYLNDLFWPKWLDSQ